MGFWKRLLGEGGPAPAKLEPQKTTEELEPRDGRDTVTVSIKKVTPLWKSLVEDLQKRKPSLGFGRSYDRVVSALSLVCPGGCGTYSREMVEMCISAGEGGAWEQEANLVPTGPIAASFSQGRCYKCGGTMINVTIDRNVLSK